MPTPPRPRPLPRPEGVRARPRRLGLALALAVGAGLAGCTSLGPDQARPVRAAAAAPARPPEVLAVDPLSAELVAYYGRIESERRANHLMRTDSGATEGRISAAQLAQTYIDVALRDERTNGSSPAVLRRWDGPVRYDLQFGATLPRATRQRDHARVNALASRLAAASGHAISLAPMGQTGGNFHVLVLSESERRDSAARLRALVPGIDDSAVRLITDMPRETFCMVLAFSRDGSATYSEAVAVIRAEHPDLTREACYHEELTQGLGLAADSGRARPSIFNDDQEFALLTDQDLLLLKIHYDPRLSPGMTESRARPIIFSIASTLAAGAS